jgi:putative tryptophan/tyrosine transport system substrate-binding protein
LKPPCPLLTPFATSNVTGVTVFSPDLETKRLELINEIVPRGATIAYLYDPNIDFADVGRRNVEAAARTLGREVRMVEASKDADLEKAFATLAETHVGGVVMAGNALFNSLRDHLLALTTRLRLPAIHETREFVVAGGLMSYGTTGGLSANRHLYRPRPQR